MAEVPKELRSWLFGSGAKQQAWLMASFTLTCWACLIVGIVGDAIDKKLGLEPTSWFLISLGFLGAAAWHYFKAYHAAKEG
jgi:hypothetical protein